MRAVRASNKQVMRVKEIAQDVACLPVSIANAYMVGDAGGWTLVDAGTPGNAGKIIQAAESRFGANRKPHAIVLTHGHFDHAGSAMDLALHWNVPIYAHHLEMPYLTGRSKYPDRDPTSPGFMAFLSRFFPSKTTNLGDKVRALEPGRDAPGLEGWDWLHTPGHAPGHISFFRPTDRVLLAGDAFTTVNLDSFVSVVSKHQRVCRPPTPMTYDWHAAEISVRKLANFSPRTIGCGHGVPMSGKRALDQLLTLAVHFPVPSHGRYVPEPARTDENGVVYLPPKPPDPVENAVVGVGVAAVMGGMFALAAHKRQKRLGSTGSIPARQA
jgi:glyoxylase-like metal-dependent hydrolase (beta-lactamase superfamily II)